MKLTPRKRENGYITSYRLIIGSREARTAGFLFDDGTGKELAKVVDAENHRIIIQLADGEKSRNNEKDTGA